jgi:TRAP-type C4-dicarboxylate transport system substrate-binding protein
LPPDLQTIVTESFNETALLQRKNVYDADQVLRATLTKQGIVFNDPDPTRFRDSLVKAGFYTKWRDKYGAEPWATLEKYAGRIA